MRVKPCSHIGCGNLVKKGRCERHSKPTATIVANPKDLRDSAAKRGYDSKWRKARLSYLKRNPLCRHCLDAGTTTAANEVDHIIRHSGQSDPLFWDRDNWQALCKPCHSKKTREEGYLY